MSKDDLSRASADSAEFIDFSRYRTRELTQNIVSILSIPESLRRILMTALIAVPLIIAITAVISALQSDEGSFWMLAPLYAAVVGIPLSIKLGLIQVATRMLTCAGEICRLLIDVSRQAARDYAAVNSGEKQLPPGAVIMEQVYDRVIVEVIESAVQEATGFLGKPLLALYRSTIGELVKQVLKWLKEHPPDPAEIAAIENDARAIVEGLGGNLAQVEATLIVAERRINKSAMIIRRAVLIPMYALFCVVSVVAAIPLALFWLLM